MSTGSDVRWSSFGKRSNPGMTAVSHTSRSYFQSSLRFIFFILCVLFCLGSWNGIGRIFDHSSGHTFQLYANLNFAKQVTLAIPYLFYSNYYVNTLTNDFGKKRSEMEGVLHNVSLIHFNFCYLIIHLFNAS